MSPASRPVSGYLVVASGDAGGSDRQAVREAVAVLAAAAPTQLRTTEEPAELHDALDDLANRRLVLAGGDGTIHLAVGALLDRGQAASTPVGLVPLGTGNDLASSLGLPLDPAQAAHRVIAGRVRTLDVLGNGEEIAVNAAHVGIGVVAARRAQQLKPFAGVLAYRLGAVWAGAASGDVTATVAVDGEPLCDGQPVLMVAVMNGSSIGGTTPVCPAADLSDGVLDVVVVTDRARARRAAFALALSRGRHLGLPGVVHRAGRQVTVRVTEPMWNLDGELVASTSPLQWQVQPGGWQVVA